MNTAEFTSKYYIDRHGSHSRKWDGEHLKFTRTDLWLQIWTLCRLSASKMLSVTM